MEKGKGPPPDDFSNIPAPPYPGPPLDQSVPVYQTPPAAGAAPQPAPQPGVQQHPQQHPQRYPQGKC